jgi:hypothetical protein
VLDLAPAELETYARGSDDDNAITAAALRDHPDEAPAAIFEVVGQYQAAKDWRFYRGQPQRGRLAITPDLALT